MTVETIFVSNDLLLGSAINFNAAFLAEQCNGLGLISHYQTVIDQDCQRVCAAVGLALQRAEIILVSGFKGDVLEDSIAKSIMEACGVSRNEIVVFKKRNGLRFNSNGKHIILLPKKESELVKLFENEVFTFLNTLTVNTIVSQVVKICGVSHIEAKSKAEDLLEKQNNPKLTMVTMPGEVHFKVVAVADCEKECQKLIKPLIKELKVRFGANIYTTEKDVTLQSAVIDLLKENELICTTAESCTGGMVAAKLVSVGGASQVYKGGFVTYANKMKRKYLGVRKSTLLKYGAVSEQTAREMAKGGCDLAKADVCVAITGIAGPDGGTDKKPVGLVYIGVCVCGQVVVKEYHFEGDRNTIRECASNNALVQLRECLLEYFAKKTFGKIK